jgi:hypothetical protein
VLLADNVKSRVLNSDGSYARMQIPAGEMPIHAQRIYLAQAQSA